MSGSTNCARHYRGWSELSLRAAVVSYGLKAEAGQTRLLLAGRIGAHATLATLSRRRNPHRPGGLTRNHPSRSEEGQGVGDRTNRKSRRRHSAFRTCRKTLLLGTPAQAWLGAMSSHQACPELTEGALSPCGRGLGEGSFT